MKIAIATKNLGKFNEFKELSVDTDYEFIQIPSSVQEMPPENGASCYANAVIKAKLSIIFLYNLNGSKIMIKGNNPLIDHKIIYMRE